MKVYHIHQKQFLPVTLNEAWDFFSSPRNLAKITPPGMDFEILYISGNGSRMYAGQIISYKIKLLPLVYVRWVTEITHVDELRYFVDDQITGPYAIWHHQHHFKEVPGGTEMTDEVTYGIPLGIIGRIANLLFVRRKLEAIFKFRHRVIAELFTKTSQPVTEAI